MRNHDIYGRPLSEVPAVPLSDGGRKVLHDILGVGVDRSLAIGRRRRVPTPGADDLYALCNLLADDPREEALQRLLEDRAGFVTGLPGGPDNVDLAVLFKPPVGTQYRADFCVLQAHQGGSVAHLIEIESAHEPIFTQGGRTARRLLGAEKQVEDWRIWVGASRQHYARELVRMAKELPMIEDYLPGDRGFRLYEPDQLEGVWNAFGGSDDPNFSYAIVIGRWSRLTPDQKARILNRNRQNGSGLRVYTYEQLARGANYRLERDDWFNDYDSWGEADGAINPL